MSIPDEYTAQHASGIRKLRRRQYVKSTKHKVSAVRGSANGDDGQRDNLRAEGCSSARLWLIDNESTTGAKSNVGHRRSSATRSHHAYFVALGGDTVLAESTTASTDEQSLTFVPNSLAPAFAACFKHCANRSARLHLVVRAR